MRSLKRRLASGRPTIGSWLSFAHPPICEMMAKAGFDWLAIDMEHAPIDWPMAHQLIQVIDLAGCVPLVRVGRNDPLEIQRAMDFGAHGVIVPKVDSPEQARDAVRALHYPPRGARGAGLSRAHRYGLDFSGHKTWSAREAVLIVQIEHINGVDAAEEIARTSGVDGLMVGPYDLSGSLGVSGRLDHPAVGAAVDRVRRAAEAAGKAAGLHIVHSDPAKLRRTLRAGFRFLAYGDDMVFLAEKIEHEASQVKKLRR